VFATLVCWHIKSVNKESSFLEKGKEKFLQCFKNTGKEYSKHYDEDCESYGGSHRSLRKEGILGAVRLDRRPDKKDWYPPRLKCLRASQKRRIHFLCIIKEFYCQIFLFPEQRLCCEKMRAQGFLGRVFGVG